MTIGIYKLNFNGTKQCYIGQSKNIELRYTSHKTNMRRGLSTKKLQEAYANFGLPTMEVLLECSINELDSIEREAIEIYDSIANGFNTMSEAGYSNTLIGEDCGNAKYTNEKILEVFFLLVYEQHLTHKDISYITGVNRGSISDLSACKGYLWIEQLYPKEYSILKELLQSRRKNRKTAASLGIKYPILIDPEGNEYEVKSLRGFCREHSLNHGALGELLRGRLCSYRNWTTKKPQS